MPIRYRIDEPRGIIWTKVSGTLTDAELMQHKRKLLEDPEFRPGMKELSDLREVERLDVTPAGVQAFASFDEKNVTSVGEHQLALLVPNDLVFGLARMYEMLTEGSTAGVMVFRDEAEARTWLGLESSEESHA